MDNILYILKQSIVHCMNQNINDIDFTNGIMLAPALLYHCNTKVIIRRLAGNLAVLVTQMLPLNRGNEITIYMSWT